LTVSLSISLCLSHSLCVSECLWVRVSVPPSHSLSLTHSLTHSVSHTNPLNVPTYLDILHLGTISTFVWPVNLPGIAVRHSKQASLAIKQSSYLHHSTDCTYIQASKLSKKCVSLDNYYILIIIVFVILIIINELYLYPHNQLVVHPHLYHFNCHCNCTVNCRLTLCGYL
jgi:hypothetical protein